MKEELKEKINKEGLEDAVKMLDKADVMSLGLGFHFSVYGIIIQIVCIMIVVKGIDEISYSFKKEPEVIATVEDIEKLKKNDYVNILLDLDFENVLQIQTIGGKQYRIFPFKGTKYSLFYYCEGPIVKKNDEIVKILPEAGRLVGKDFAGEWDLGANRSALDKDFKKIGIDINENALVLEPKDPGFPHPWLLFIFVMSLLNISWFLTRLINTIKMLSDKQHLAEYIAKKMKA